MKPTLNISKRKYSIQSMRRGMRVLDVLLDSRTPLKLEQICAQTGLVKSTAFRIVSNLLEGDFLTQTEQGYWLGLKMLRFGALVEEKLDVKREALPFLIHLRDQVNETVHLAVLDNDWRVVYLEKLPAEQAIGIMMSRVGITTPMYCTGLGKALAAFQPESELRCWLAAHPLEPFTRNTIVESAALLKELRRVRTRGYATDNGEHEEHVRCLAAPIKNRNGTVIAAISVAGPDTRMPRPLVGSTLSTQVTETARSISQALGCFG